MPTLIVAGDNDHPVPTSPWPAAQSSLDEDANRSQPTVPYGVFTADARVWSPAASSLLAPRNLNLAMIDCHRADRQSTPLSIEDLIAIVLKPFIRRLVWAIHRHAPAG